MVIIDGVTIKNPCKEGRPPDQQHLVSELPFEMLRVCVFQAVQERWGTGAISLRGLREAIEWRLGVSLAHRKPAIRQLAEEAADVMSQLPSALNDSGRGRELFLRLVTSKALERGQAFGNRCLTRTGYGTGRGLTRPSR